MKQSEKGSVTMIVAVTIFFIVILLSSFFIYTTSRRRAQLEETEKIAEAYDGDMEAIYEEINSRYEEKSLFKYDAKTSAISLYSLDSLNTLDNDNNKEIEELTIPSEYNGQLVTTISAYAFKGCSSLKSVTIPESIQSIEDGAFEDWTTSQTIYIEGKASEKDFTILGQNCFGSATVIYKDANNQNTNEITDTKNLNNTNENLLENEQINETNLINNI